MVEIKGLFWVKSKGKTYYYAWKGGPRIHAEYGCAEFLLELQEARDPLANADKTKFRAWITLYKASHDYLELADSTKRVWSPWFDHIRDEFGDLSTRQFSRPKIRVAIKKWRDKWRDRPRAADMGKQVLSRILSFVVAEGELAENMCEGVPNLYSADRSDIIWTDEDLATLCKHASPEVGNAARLAGLTGLRQGDLLKLTWKQVGRYAIEIKTGKGRGKRSALVPITAELRTLLDSIPKRGPIVLTNTEGVPWKGGFGMSWNKAKHRAGLAEKNLHFHDLRGTAATKLFLAGLTIREIAEILAWSEDKVERLINRYVKRDEILKARIRRIEDAEKGFEAAG